MRELRAGIGSWLLLLVVEMHSLNASLQGGVGLGFLGVGGVGVSMVCATGGWRGVAGVCGCG